jgi:Zn-dependent protease/tetratricopeptide (TPR) repeat protein
VYAGLTLLLCLATFFGLKLDKPWGRWTGAAVSSLLLIGFPLLTAAGLVGLYAMFAKPLPPDPGSRSAPPPAAAAATGLRASGRDPVAQPFVIGIAMILGFQGLAFLTLYAQRNGMPASNPGFAWWVFFFLLLFVQAALHELGHAAMAWTVFFRVRVIAIGPFTCWDDGYGYRFRLEWKRLLDSTGYMGAVPVSEDDLLLKQTAVIAGGPLLSLVTGGLFLLAFLALPGTGWEAAWLMLAFNAVLGLGYGVMSLLPIGDSDGAMLYHLLRDTPAGRQPMGRIKVSLVREQAAAAHSRADFRKEVEFRQVALQLAGEAGERDSMAIAAGHLALGNALLALEDWPRAQAEFSKCLEFEAECGRDASLRANCWWGLQAACLERYLAEAAARAGAAAVKAIEERKPARNRASMAVTRTMLAQVHLRAGAFEAALAAATEALALVPRHRGRLMLRAAIFSVQAQAHLSLGADGPGMEAAREAAAILTSSAIPESSRNLASDALGELGEILWKTGSSGPAVDLMRQAVRQLESGGATATAAQYRIKLAAALRALGRHAEALYALPGEETLPPSALRSLLGERAELHLAAGHPQEAAADARALLALWQPEPAAATEIAVAEGLLARANLEAGNPAEAEPLARHAAAVLADWGHPGAAGCRITLALAARERSPAAFDEALRLIESAPLLGAAEKTRRLEAERARIGRCGPIQGSNVLSGSMPVACD